MGRIQRYCASALLVSFICISFFPYSALADTVSIGILTPALGARTDVDGNHFLHEIAVANITGDESPVSGSPAFPVLTPIIFKNSQLTLVGDDGSKENLFLGDIIPATRSQPDRTVFFYPDTQDYASAHLSGTLSESRFLLADGHYFTPFSLDISADLLRRPGNQLNGLPASLIEVTGVISPVPLPTTWFLMGSGLAGLLLLEFTRREQKV